MKRGAPLKRTAWKRAKSTTPRTDHGREQRIEARALAAMTNVVARPANAGPSTTPPRAVLKEAPVRSEAYRRLVAQLPCKFCGIAGYSQCAHANTGKGAGIKASDLDSFPLCCDRPGQRGCHSYFDQGALMGKTERRLIEPAWVADTQRQIHAMGIWPKKLTYPHGEPS